VLSAVQAACRPRRRTLLACQLAGGSLAALLSAWVSAPTGIGFTLLAPYLTGFAALAGAGAASLPWCWCWLESRATPAPGLRYDWVWPVLALAMLLVGATLWGFAWLLARVSGC